MNEMFFGAAIMAAIATIIMVAVWVWGWWVARRHDPEDPQK